MAATGQTIATMSARDVSLAHHEIVPCKSFHVIANGINNPDKLVADGHRHRNRFLRPGVPVINMHISSTDRCFQNTDEHLVAANSWNGNLFKPETGLRLRLYNGLHHLLHDRKLSQSG